MFGQSPENVLLIANESSPVSKSIAEYYARKRGVPADQVCYLRVTTDEQISREVYTSRIVAGVKRCLAGVRLRGRIRYFVTTLGVPLGIQTGGSGMSNESAAVDSELTTLYRDLRGRPAPTAGPLQNPFFQQRRTAFDPVGLEMYLVTRLAGYDFADVRKMIDRSLEARNRGTVVLDMRNGSDEAGEDWLRDAAIRLPQERVRLDQGRGVLYREQEVIGYASWGSNDPNRKQRWVGFGFLPGAIVTEYVSTNGRTFARPPADWNLSTWNGKDQPKWFAGSPQSLTADYIHAGATGASGHVYEPYLQFCPRPDILFPEYLGGRNLVESYYLAMPAISWMNIVVGDPLCRLRN